MFSRYRRGNKHEFPMSGGPGSIPPRPVMNGGRGRMPHGPTKPLVLPRYNPPRVDTLANVPRTPIVNVIK
jgi:hypothetical protein